MTKNHCVCDISIGGIFARPTTGIHDKMDPSKARNALVKMLNGRKDVVKEVWDLEEDKFKDKKSSVHNMTYMRYDESGDKGTTYFWEYPLIWRLKVDKEFGFKDNSGRRKTGSSIDAIIIYNGIWFMDLVDLSQFSNIDEIFFCGPNIRDILVNLMSNNKIFVPDVVPPCVLPADLIVQIDFGAGKGRKGVPEYIGSLERKNSSGLILKYRTGSEKISNEELVEVAEDFYFSTTRSFERFYILAKRASIEEDKRATVLELYDRICKDLQKYLEVKYWDIFKGSRIAGELSKNVSSIQVQLVRNRLSQVKIIKTSEEINTLEDNKGVMDNLREYLKHCIVKNFEQGTIEYEGLEGTLQHIERVSSQHNLIILGIVAIFAGFMGALIGAWIS